VAVEPGQGHARALGHLPGGGESSSAPHGEAELGVLGARFDVLVGVGLHARGHPHQHPGSRQAALDQLLDAVELDARVGHHPAHAASQGGGQLLLRLVVAVEDDALGGETGRQGHVQLPAGGHVQMEALLFHQAHHGPAQEGLAGVGHSLAEVGPVLPAARPQMVGVVDEERGPEPLGQLAQIASAHRKAPVGAKAGAGREQGKIDGRCGHPGSSSSRTMRSGAERPRRARESARPIRQASASHSRAWVVAASSLMTRWSW
jgi:hypothetical protein